MRWREDKGDNTALRFTWDLFSLAGDPLYDEKARGLTGDSIYGSPDGIWVDDDSRVWIQTDISNSAQNLKDRGYDRIGNNAMLVGDPVTREIKRFLTGPRGCEITGVINTPDNRTMFVNVQHPGESTTFWNALNGPPLAGRPPHGQQLAGAGPRRPAPPGDRRHHQGRRRRHRHLTLPTRRPARTCSGPAVRVRRTTQVGRHRT